jgi:hypothetical protein
LNKLIPFIFVLILSGCASTSVEQPLKVTYQPYEKVGIIQFTTEHAGKFSDAMTMSPIISAISYSVEEEGGGEDYVKELNNEIFIEIENKLNLNPLISFSKSLNKGLLVPDNITPVSINEFAVKNDLSYMLSVNVRYTSGSGFSKPVSLIVTWNIFNHLGEKIGEVETIEVTKETFDHFPNSMDIKYKKTYLSLVEPIVKRFISYFTKVDKIST